MSKKKPTVMKTRSKVHRPDGYGINTHNESDGEPWYMGHVRTTHGFVAVYSDSGYTRMSFISKGIEHGREVRRGYSRTRLVTEAQRFVNEMLPVLY